MTSEILGRVLGWILGAAFIVLAWWCVGLLAHLAWRLLNAGWEYGA